MSITTVPQKTTVLVVGGGPAGSYAASVLARRNINVTIFESSKFPRYHIGESLLASTNYFLEYIGAREKILNAGFVKKPGGAFKMRSDFPETYTDFVDHHTGNHALNVIRSEYDEILLRHAASQGANVFEEHKITALKFSPSDPNRPVAAEWESKTTEAKGSIDFDYIIDASGRQGILSTKYHKDRKMTQSLKNTAIWAYWNGCKSYGEGGNRFGSPLTEALHDNTGWCWLIPVDEETVSIGFVMHEEHVKSKKAGKSLEDMYLDQFQFLELATELRGDATMFPSKQGKGSPVYMASDYSYAAEDVGKLNYRLAGDAAAFIDPFFASGVHLAFVGALSAALSLISVIDGKADETAAAEFHNLELKTAWTRFFVVVMAGYKQMRTGMKANVLYDVDETSFDRAFGLIRPVIQGTGDVGVDRTSSGNVELSEQEVHKMIDFVNNLFTRDGETTTGGQNKLGDVDGDACSRLSTLTQNVPYSLGRDGVKEILDEARESMRFKVLGNAASHAKAIETAA